MLPAILEPSRDALLRGRAGHRADGLDAAGDRGARRRRGAAASAPRALRRLPRRLAARAAWASCCRRCCTPSSVQRALLRRSDGERRLTNLLHLAECLHQAAETHESPDALLRWLQRSGATGAADDAAQLRLESDQNLVQIVTIHKAKGLEFPSCSARSCGTAAAASAGRRRRRASTTTTTDARDRLPPRRRVRRRRRR